MLPQAVIGLLRSVRCCIAREFSQECMVFTCLQVKITFSNVFLRPFLQCTRQKINNHTRTCIVMYEAHKSQYSKSCILLFVRLQQTALHPCMWHVLPEIFQMMLKI